MAALIAKRGNYSRIRCRQVGQVGQVGRVGLVGQVGLVRLCREWTALCGDDIILFRVMSFAEYTASAQIENC